MSFLFRSEDMTYVSITMTNESSYETIKQIGVLGKLHIVDLAASKDAPSKQHVAYKKRMADCLYWEKRLTQFEEEIRNKDIPLSCNEPTEVVGGDVLESIAAYLDPIEKDYTMSSQFLKECRSERAMNVEKQHVLNVMQTLELQSEGPNSYSNQDIELEFRNGNREDDTRFRSFIYGTIPTENQGSFNRMLYRVSRGNAFAEFRDIPNPVIDPATGEPVQKSVFYIVLLGNQLTQRVTKMCDIFRCNVFKLPNTKRAIKTMLEQIQVDINNTDAVIAKTEASIFSMLNKLAGDGLQCPLRNWLYTIRKERNICSVFMKAHFYLTMVAIEGWIPSEEMKELKKAIKNAVSGSGNPPAHLDIDPSNPIKSPSVTPTYFKLDQFTETFQGIVNTYGVPRYKEINPGLFTCVTFPFLFGVMYGDIGHGTLLSIFALLMCIYEKPLLAKQKRKEMNELIGLVFGGRYCLLFMGLFAVYNGILYNDCLSIPLNIYGSTFTEVNNTGTYQWNGGVYPLGVDPSWAHKQNELAFYNSMKMKMSVIIGVIHMTFGIILSCVNHLYFNDTLSIVLEFLPRLLFMICSFGYMIFMIIFKWTQSWDGRVAPNLIQTMIKMFLGFGSVDPTQPLFNGQAGLQTFFVIVCLLSIPVMLFGKPLAHNYLHKKRHNQHQEKEILRSLVPNENSHSSDDILDEKQAIIGAHDDSHAHGGHGDGEFSFSGEMIHNGIHTIEFVLGSISNTASYLRLWALSLAHAQLAKVFWEKLMSQYGYESGVLFAFVGFSVWFFATFAVLLSMDVLECFLHALRLHWVEFQNKFYYADGILFDPFVFDSE